LAGKVYLVGAGPGDPELLTLKARRIISIADVVLFDRLLSPQMLEGARGELIDVGKSAGSHKMTQEEINRLLIEKAEEGKTVVRLKGGDPYLFGRGGEEAVALRERGIPVEVVPGVTSAIAAPELAGIPVTHRGVSSSLTIVTGHEEHGKDSPLDWSALARLGGTLVVLMGVSRLERNVSLLLEGGISPLTPAAIVEKGGWAEQRLVTGALGDIAARARRAKIEPPAILVVGDVVGLSGMLAPRKIALLRAAGQMEESARLARDFGFQPICAPAIALQKRDLPADLHQRIERCDCLVFTSANGVKMAMEREDIRSLLGEKLLISIGPRTKQALQNYGFSSATPREYSSAGLEELLKGRYQRVLFLRSAQGSKDLSRELEKSGLEVDDVSLYEVVPSHDPRLDELLLDPGQADVFAFTSSSTARFLMQRAMELGLADTLNEALDQATVAAIGKPTAEELARLDIRVDVMPEEFTFPALLRALRRPS
jgi:uroporphyrinogen III methyltransferase/synthase